MTTRQNKIISIILILTLVCSICVSAQAGIFSTLKEVTSSKKTTEQKASTVAAAVKSFVGGAKASASSSGKASHVSSQNAIKGVAATSFSGKTIPSSALETIRGVAAAFTAGIINKAKTSSARADQIRTQFGPTARDSLVGSSNSTSLIIKGKNKGEGESTFFVPKNVNVDGVKLSINGTENVKAWKVCVKNADGSRKWVVIPNSSGQNEITVSKEQIKKWYPDWDGKSSLDSLFSCENKFGEKVKANVFISGSGSYETKPANANDKKITQSPKGEEGWEKLNIPFDLNDPKKGSGDIKYKYRKIGDGDAPTYLFVLGAGSTGNAVMRDFGDVIMGTKAYDGANVIVYSTDVKQKGSNINLLSVPGKNGASFRASYADKVVNNTFSKDTDNTGVLSNSKEVVISAHSLGGFTVNNLYKSASNAGIHVPKVVISDGLHPKSFADDDTAKVRLIKGQTDLLLGDLLKGTKNGLKVVISCTGDNGAKTSQTLVNQIKKGKLPEGVPEGSLIAVDLRGTKNNYLKDHPTISHTYALYASDELTAAIVDTDWKYYSGFHSGE